MSFRMPWMRPVDPAVRPEVQAQEAPRRKVLQPLSLDTRLVGDIYVTILCSRPDCGKWAVATDDPDARLCEDHA